MVTLVLTMGGLYAVLTMAVGQRTRELAIRMVLGAREGSVRWMVLSEGLRLVASGALMEKRITRAFQTLNKLGETQTCAIVPEYLGLKISALRLAHEFTEKREAEKEEQRQIREQMREEERVRREITTMRALTKRRSRAPGGSAGHPGDGVLWSPPGNGGAIRAPQAASPPDAPRGSPGVRPRTHAPPFGGRRRRPTEAVGFRRGAKREQPTAAPGVDAPGRPTWRGVDRCGDGLSGVTVAPSAPGAGCRRFRTGWRPRRRHLCGPRREPDASGPASCPLSPSWRRLRVEA